MRHLLQSCACIWASSMLIAALTRTPALSSLAAQAKSHAAPLQPGLSAYQRGLIALKENRLGDALAALTLAARDQPDDASLHNFLGIVLAQLHRSAAATAEYHEAIRLDPGLESAYRNLGFLEWNQRQLDLARGDLQTALQLSPPDLFAHLYLGRVELDAGRYDAAFRELSASGMALPDDPDVQMLAAHGHLALGESAQAGEIAQRLLPRKLSAVQTSHLAALLLATQSDDAASLLLQRWIKNNGPGESWISFDLALVYLHAGKFAQAGAAVRCRAEPIRTSAELAADECSLLGIAETHLTAGDHGVDALRRATLLAPASEEHWLNLTRELMELGRVPAALAATQDAIRAHPQSYALQLRLGAVYLAGDHYADAEKVFRDLMDAGDPLPTSSVGLAQVLLRTGRADQAVTELAKAQQRLGSSFLLSYFQGIAFNRAGRPADAAAAFQEAVNADPKSSEAHFELGKTYLKGRNFDAATAELEEALRLNPHDPQSSRLLAQARSHTGAQARDPGSAQEASESPASAPHSDFIGDFILPSWREPSPATATNASP